MAYYGSSYENELLISFEPEYLRFKLLFKDDSKSILTKNKVKFMML